MRMIAQVAQARTGDEYPYYSCLGRHSKRTTCDLRSISISIVKAEDLIQGLYDRLALRPSRADSLRQVLLAELRTFTKDTNRQRTALHTQKLEIEREQRKLIEAHYNDAIPIDMLRTEQHSLDSALNSVTRQLDALNTDLEDNTSLIERAIDLAQHSADAYRRATDQIRRLPNQVLFDRLKVTMTDEDEHRLEAIVAALFAELLSAGVRSRTVAESLRGNEELPASAGGEFPLFQSVSAARVSVTSTMVGLAVCDFRTSWTPVPRHPGHTPSPGASARAMCRNMLDTPRR